MNALKSLLFILCTFNIRFGASRTVVQHAPNAIINGTDADIGDFPFVVSIQWGTQHKCGGTLLNADSVLTAAHCYGLIFDDNPLSEIQQNARIVAGSANWKVPDRQTFQEAKIKSIIWHYDIPKEWQNNWFDLYLSTSPIFDTSAFDFMILKLNTTIIETDAVQFASLANAEPAVGSICEVIGWGRAETDPPDMENLRAPTFPAVLQRGEMKIMSNQECGRQWNLPQNASMGAGQVCVEQMFRDGKGQAIPCFGDSGSPLVCQSDGKRVVSGQVLGGPLPCIARTNEPPKYMRISSARQFINGSA